MEIRNHINGEWVKPEVKEYLDGNVGINIGVAAPMAFFPFSGWKDSFFGDMHRQGMAAVEFLHRKKLRSNIDPRNGRGNFNYL
jgi:malonate-semialdehyde dehydrogenase (acetylating) / methylmalonate-semialdehyde dehydrogenase